MAHHDGDLGLFNLETLWSGLGEVKTSGHAGVYNWVGDFYPYGSFPRLPAEGWQSPRTPDAEGDGFRAGPAEWVALALAVKLAVNGTCPPTMIEAGASQGLWCLPWIRCLNRFGDRVSGIRATAFEASPSLDETESFWKAQDLQLARTTRAPDRLTLEGERWTLDWIQHAISHYDGTAFFPNVSCQAHNGKSLTDTSTGTAAPSSLLRSIRSWFQRKPDEALMPVQVDSFAATLERIGPVGLLHMDLQGEELAIIRHHAIDAIRGRVDVFMLGTHSTEVETLAVDYLPTLGFSLLLQVPAMFRRQKLYRDGEQLWISNKALEAAREAGMIRGTATLTAASRQP